MSMFNDISCGTKDNATECLANAKLVSLYARRVGKGQWSFNGPVSEKSGTPQVKTVHKESGTKLQKGCCWNLQKADIHFPIHESIVQRSAQKQRPWKIVDTLLCRFGDDSNCLSHNYLCKSAQSLRSRRRNV